MANIEIRRVTFKDIDILQKICKATFYETYASGNTEEDMKHYLEAEFSLNKLKSELNNEFSEFYFASLNQEIIAYLKINFGISQTEFKDENTLEIQRIYVLKEFQGMQVGKSLYKKVIDIARLKQVDYVWLGVWEKNPNAIQFYEKMGFIAFDQHIFRLGNDEQTDIMMKKEINAGNY